MHPDLSQHLHSPECNALIKLLQECHTDKPFAKLFGACNSINSEMNRCLKLERQAKRARSMEDGKKRRERMKAAQQETE